MILERTKGTLSEDGLLVQTFPSTLIFYSSVTVPFHNGNLVIEAMRIEVESKQDFKYQREKMIGWTLFQMLGRQNGWLGPI